MNTGDGKMKGMRANRQVAQMLVEIDGEAYNKTGEVKVIGEPLDVYHEKQRNGFEIAYMNNLADVLNVLKGKEVQVFAYILTHKDSMNALNITAEAMAKRLNISQPTVFSALHTLIKADAISKSGTVIRLNPDITANGSATRALHIGYKYKREREEMKKKGDKKDGKTN